MKTALSVMVALVLVSVTACRPPAAPTPVTTVPAAPAVTTAPPATTPTPLETIGGLADLGATLFSNRCARCHGAAGQGLVGPALIGPNSNLTKFKTADGIYQYVSLAMPYDNPGSLTTEQYTQVVSFLLLRNQLAERETRLENNGLEAIKLLP